jgi:hypothetical protein
MSQKFFGQDPMSQKNFMIMRRSVKSSKKDKVCSKTKISVTEEERNQLSKQLQLQQNMLQSISQPIDIENFLSGNGNAFDDKYTVSCPLCRYKMNRKDVIDGFDDDVLNYKTTCCNCNYRFITIDRIGEDNNYFFVWLCYEQTKDQFQLWKSKQNFEKDEDVLILLAIDRPEILFNAYRFCFIDFFKTRKKAIEDWLGI